MSHAQPHASQLASPTTAGFRRMFAPRKLTCGLFFPIAAYTGDMPVLDELIAEVVQQFPAHETGSA